MAKARPEKQVDDFIERIRQKNRQQTGGDALFADIKAGDKSALSRAITLVESLRHEDIAGSHQLLVQCLAHRKPGRRIAITGTPGVGKSTFINTYARLLADGGKRVAILSVDPSSYLSRGSILGDKTRMDALTGLDNVYIRPSATGDTLGGVHEKTRESILLCEAAGYDHIIVETVGVGQSEYMVQRMTDVVVLLLQPGSGDELQGIKKGIVEMADLLVINKADLFPKETVVRSATDYRQAITLSGGRADGWQPRVLTCSGLNAKSVKSVSEALDEYFGEMSGNGKLARRRDAQWKMWFDDSLGWAVREALRQRGRHIREYYPAPGELPPAKAMAMIDSLFTEGKP